MKVLLPVVLAAAMLAAGASAWAVPSLGGPTGLVTAPTAVVAPVDEWQLAVGQRTFDAGWMEDDASLWSFYLLKGVAEDAELWVAFTRSTDGANADVWEYGGKYEIGERLFPKRGPLAGTKIAVGGSLGRWSEAVGMYSADLLFPIQVETMRAYIVATKQMIPAVADEWRWQPAGGTRVIGSAGLLYLRVTPEFGDRDHLVRPFVGAEIIGRDNLTLAVEYRAKDSDLERDPVLSVMLRRQFGSGTHLELGRTNASQIGLGTGDQRLFLRLCYSIPTLAYH